MQKVLTVGAAAAFLLCAIAPGLRADATSDARKQIQLAYNAQNAAAARKDRSAMFANMATDFVAISPSGEKVTLQQVKAALPRMLGPLQNIKAVSVIKEISLKGKTAYVTVDERLDGTAMAPAPGQKTPRAVKVAFTDTSEDVWVKGARGWLIKQSHNIRQARFVNGKPAPMG